MTNHSVAHLFRNVDILIGGLELYKNHVPFYTPTKPYYRDDITWCINAPKELPKWMNFYVVTRDWPFPVLTFIAFYLSSSMLYVCTANAEQRLTFHHCHLTIFQVMLCISSNYDPKSFFIKLAWIGAVLCCLVLNVIACAYYTMFQITPGFWSQAENTNELKSYKFQLSGELKTLQMLSDLNMVTNEIF